MILMQFYAVTNVNVMNQVESRAENKSVWNRVFYKRTYMYQRCVYLDPNDFVSVSCTTGWLKKIPHRKICNISATSGLILKILVAA